MLSGFAGGGNEKARIDNAVDTGLMRFWRFPSMRRASCCLTTAHERKRQDNYSCP
ncbi:hypothetical protein [Burkholderia sp. MS455]|uniref:hypothetical protein n=1 Tax=Burkholderia sp. MS455 TaxID=2811788 RepID=UPI00195C6D68|nr:hypothetical protein [Burkholderia sp. MS455]